MGFDLVWLSGCVPFMRGRQVRRQAALEQCLNPVLTIMSSPSLALTLLLALIFRAASSNTPSRSFDDSAIWGGGSKS